MEGLLCTSASLCLTDRSATLLWPSRPCKPGGHPPKTSTSLHLVDSPPPSTSPGATRPNATPSAPPTLRCRPRRLYCAEPGTDNPLLAARSPAGVVAAPASLERTGAGLGAGRPLPMSAGVYCWGEGRGWTRAHNALMLPGLRLVHWGLRGRPEDCRPFPTCALFVFGWRCENGTSR